MTETNPQSAIRNPQSKEVYAFATRCRCPRCRSVATVATGTHGPIQQRICKDCGRRFQAVGWRI